MPYVVTAHSNDPARPLARCVQVASSSFLLNPSVLCLFSISFHSWGFSNTTIVYVYYTKFLNVDEEELGKWDLFFEGFAAAFGVFLVRLPFIPARILQFTLYYCTPFAGRLSCPHDLSGLHAYRCPCVSSPFCPPMVLLLLYRIRTLYTDSFILFSSASAAFVAHRSFRGSLLTLHSWTFKIRRVSSVFCC